MTLLAVPATAQSVSPNADWHTIQSQHFYVHFTPPLEPLARRLAGDAERAYSELSKDLHPPRGMVDIVLSDDVDLSNGSATPFPTNRIIVYANPPVDESALRYTNDWAQLVITHELTHIFHLDRTRGVWSLGQHIFGRADALFPNLYQPSWLTEGLAVYEESRLTGAGRIIGSEHRMIARAFAVDHRFPTIGALSLAQNRYPFGESTYGFGSLFVDYLAHSRGEDRIRQFVDKSAAELIPYILNIPAKSGFGISFSEAWKQYQDSVIRSVGPNRAPINGWRDLTRDGAFVEHPRWWSDSELSYTGTPGKQSYGLYRIETNGKRSRIGRRNSGSANLRLPNGDILFTQLELINPYVDRSDLWIQHRGHERRLTYDKRLTNPDVRADGLILASQIQPGTTRLVLVSPDGERITPITTGSYDEQWTEARWSHSGRHIVASRWMRGNISQIVVLDTAGRLEHIVSSGHWVESAPSWLPDDAGIAYSSDRTGSAQIYVERFPRPGSFDGGETYRLSDAITGLFDPNVSTRSNQLAAVIVRSDGFHLGETNLGAGERVARMMDTTLGRYTDTVVTAGGAVTKFSPWRTFVPHYWLPTIDQSIRGGYRIGAMTSGADVVGRHIMTATVEVPTDNTGIVGNFAYQYAGFGNPVIQADGGQDWEYVGSVAARNAQRTILGDLYRRRWTGDLTATLIRARFRSFASLTAGFGVERRSHVTTNGVPIASFDSLGQFGTQTYPTFIAAVGYSNAQRPIYSISPEDGIAFNTTFRDRFNSGVTGSGGASYSTVVTASIYKSLNLPGFAHHVLAVRGSAGYADDRANGYYQVGGISGTTYEIIPGYTVGEGRKSFPVRGFEPATLIGTRALSGSVEYRIPLWYFGKAPGIWPFFVDRSSLTFFGDYGTAWCPNIALGREVCNRVDPALTNELRIASAGGEVNLNLGILSWDSPTRLRLGVVTPTHNGALFGRSAVQAYFAAGLSF